jgi:uncharacterized protein HemX
MPNDDPPPVLYSPAPRDRFQSTSEGFNLLGQWGAGIQEQVHRQAYQLADHEGQLKTVPTIISAVQSSLSSWTTGLAAISAALLAAMAILAAVFIYIAQRTDGQITDTQTKIESTKSILQTDITTLGGKVDQDSVRITRVEQSVQTATQKVDVLDNKISALSASSQRIEDNIKSLLARKTGTPPH